MIGTRRPTGCRETVPTDTATFDVSNITDVSISAGSTLGAIVFNTGASAFSFTTDPAAQDAYLHMTITGSGITNNSGIVQSFLLRMDPAGNGSSIEFVRGAMAGSSLSFTNEANPTGDYLWGCYVNFTDSASAGAGSYHNNGSSTPVSWGGIITFYDSATASNGTFVNDGASASGAFGGYLAFTQSSDAGNATIICNGGTVSGADSGQVGFEDFSSPGNATIIINPSLVEGAEPARLRFLGYKASSENTARVELFGDGVMFVDEAGVYQVELGSLEGDGEAYLGKKQLTLGRNDRSSTFSGLITGYGIGPAIKKIGRGTFNLTGANTYTGQTTVYEGGLAVNNTTGSATGTGPVVVNGGATLSGAGSIAGPVTIGTDGGNDAAALLSPGRGARGLVALTVQSALTLKPNAVYNCRLSTRRSMTDAVIANGVTIESGARFLLKARDNQTLTAGTVFTVISNTATTPISGTFANLADGSTVTAGPNTLQVSYEGGDGNDLTLTVVP